MGGPVWKDECLTAVFLLEVRGDECQPAKSMLLFPQVLPPSRKLLIYLLYIYWLLTTSLCLREQPPQLSALGNIHQTQQSQTEGEFPAKRRTALEYPNEMKLKWGTIIERQDRHTWRLDLCSPRQSVFFFSWIEYQLISWVICSSGNWVEGWVPTPHVQTLHIGTGKEKAPLWWPLLGILDIFIQVFFPLSLM